MLSTIPAYMEFMLDSLAVNPVYVNPNDLIVEMLWWNLMTYAMQFISTVVTKVSDVTSTTVNNTVSTKDAASSNDTITILLIQRVQLMKSQ